MEPFKNEEALTALCFGDSDDELLISLRVVKLCIRSVLRLVPSFGFYPKPMEGSRVVNLVGFGTDTLLTLSVE